MTMIILDKEKLDPRNVDPNEIRNSLLAFKTSGQTKVTVEWFDLSLNQEEAQASYLPLVHYAQEIGLNVYCVMSQKMCESLVRYKRLMFVDTLFLRKFKFKEINFTIPYFRPDLMR
jgi:hypothetical protein